LSGIATVYVLAAAATGSLVKGKRETRVCGKRSKKSIDNVLSGARASTATMETTEWKVK